MFKRGLSLFLAILMLVTVVQTYPLAVVGEEREAVFAAGTGGSADMRALSPEMPDPTPQEPDLTSTEPEPEAAVENLKLSYRESSDTITLSYQMVHCAYVSISVNGKELEGQYRGTIFDYTDAEEGRTYEFEVVPYNLNGTQGAPVQASYAVPYKKAVVSDVDADYNLEKKVLIVDWEGDNIAYADVYQDNVLIASKISAYRIIREIDLAPKSRHTYKIVPYNKNDEVGTENSYLLEVDDYVARIDLLEAEYNETTKQVEMKWEDTYTEYVEISLNDEVLVEKYTGKTFVIKCELQPGATYIVSVLPYNYNDEEGEEEEEDVSVGYFDVPEELSVSQASIPVKNKAGVYTGFSKPQVEVSWEAQAGASYELYRAEKDKKGAYQWIANVKSEIEGIYTYVDEKAGFGIYYYKVRRIITLDPYIDQELYTALSDAEGVNALVPKAALNASQNEYGQVFLTMAAKKGYVSGFDIYRKCGNGKYRLLASTTENVYVDTEVEFGKSYHYKVKAYYFDASSGKKTSGKYSKASTVKNTIGGMQAEAVAISADTVKLTWTKAANAEGYEIYYKSGTQGDSYVFLDQTDSLSMKYKLKASGTYYFMIKAYQKGKKGTAHFSSTEVSVKMGFAAPTGLKIDKTAYEKDKTGTLFQIDTISWNQVYGAKGYYVEVYNEAKGKYKRVAKIKNKSVTSYTISNPVTAEGKTLKYRVRAYAGKKVKSGGTLEITPRLGTVKGVKAVKSKSMVKITWNSVLGAERYQVYRSNGRTAILVGETDGNSITDQGLGIGVPYQYYVQALNNTQKLTGEISELVTFTLHIKKVTNLTAANKAAGSVQLSWSGSEDAKKYVIYYKTSSNGEYKKLAEISSKNTSYLHKVQKTGTTYYYKVTAMQKNCAGISVESAGASVSVEVLN